MTLWSNSSSWERLLIFLYSTGYFKYWQCDALSGFTSLSGHLFSSPDKVLCLSCQLVVSNRMKIKCCWSKLPLSFMKSKSTSHNTLSLKLIRMFFEEEVHSSTVDLTCWRELKFQSICISNHQYEPRLYVEA